MERYDFGLTTPGSKFSIKTVSWEDRRPAPSLLLSESIKCFLCTCIGAVLLAIPFDRKGLFGRDLTVISGEMLKLLEVMDAELEELLGLGIPLISVSFDGCSRKLMYVGVW